MYVYSYEFVATHLGVEPRTYLLRVSYCSN
ncbi:uncharacterized protein METZ01_LOCUS268957 [marine metagenome]|uniref:Uncharacterized protein n=1 Tax=marine metagenome TaxID=408172 RepID=A0A382JY01_9ZZZZ